VAILLKVATLLAFVSAYKFRTNFKVASKVAKSVPGRVVMSPGVVIRILS
jgi:hypothetical protein